MKYLPLVLFLFTFSLSSAQSNTPVQDFSKDPRVYTQRRSFWFEGNLNGNLSKDTVHKLTYQVDLQYRRSGDADYINNANVYNIFQDLAQAVVRPWIHYWPVADKIRLSASPAGIWGTWSSPSEGQLVYFPEIRSSYQLTFFQRISKWEFQHRYRYEFRFIGAKNSSCRGNLSDVFTTNGFPSDLYKNRVRYMFRVTRPLGARENSYLTFWNELFIGLGRNNANNKIVDQNRFIAMYGRKLNKQKYPMKLEVGLMWQLQPKYNITIPPTQSATYGSFENNNWESNLALQLYWIFDDFHHFRHSKKNRL